MANPQPDQYTKISNELYLAIMMTDFSKRQRKILDLIMRCSYGCGKKSAMLKPSDYEVVGLYKTHITKELRYLEKANVIAIKWDTYETTLNKDYDTWRVSLAKTADMEKFNEILKRNLEHKKETCGQSCGNPVHKSVDNHDEEEDSYQNSNQKVTKTVTGGYQNSNLGVTKTVTARACNPSDDAELPGPKEIIKEIYKENKKISSYSNNDTPVDNSINSELQRVAHEYTSCGYGTISATTGEILEELIKEYSAEWVCTALRVGLEQGKRTLSYVRGILENWKREGGIRLEKPKKPTTRDRPKNKFHNFDQPMLKYTKEQLDEILFKRKSADRGG